MTLHKVISYPKVVLCNDCYLKSLWYQETQSLLIKKSNILEKELKRFSDSFTFLKHHVEEITENDRD